MGVIITGGAHGDKPTQEAVTALEEDLGNPVLGEMGEKALCFGRPCVVLGCWFQTGTASLDPKF